jgi:protein O-mannosyl-transferase
MVDHGPPPAPRAPAAGGASPPRTWRGPAALAALLAVTAAAYLPAVDGEFVFDDLPELMGPLVRAPFDHGVREWSSSARPLVTLTFALNDLAVGSDPRGWHLTSIAIHLAAVLLGVALARRTLSRAGLADPAGPALAVAALFALHPLQAEAVAYLSQRAEILAAGLYLAALLFLLERDATPGPARRAALLLGAALAQGLGLLAKPTAATLPAAWLLWAAVVPPAGEADLSTWQRLRARLLPAAPLLALSLAAAARALRMAEGSGHAGFQVEGLPPLAYLATQLRVVPAYLGLAAWPGGLRVDWDVARSAGLLEWRALAGGLFLSALVALAGWLVAWSRERVGDGAAAARTGALGVLFFLLTLAPSSSVVPLADVMAEHRVYLGVLGLALGVAAAGAWAVRRLAGRRAGLAGWAVAAAACALLAGLTASRAAVWASAEALWRDAVEKAPGKARPHLNLGVALLARGRLQEGLEAFRRAEALDVGRAVPDELLLTNVVDTLASLGRIDEARQAVLAALARWPDSGVALGLLVRVEFGARRFDEAEAAAGRALEVDPGNAQAQKFLGMLRARRGELGSARTLLRGAARVRPQDVTIQWELGRVEEAVGDLQSACAAYRRAATGQGLAAVAARAAAAATALGCP